MYMYACVHSRMYVGLRMYIDNVCMLVCMKAYNYNIMFVCKIVGVYALMYELYMHACIYV